MRLPLFAAVLATTACSSGGSGGGAGDTLAAEALAQAAVLPDVQSSFATAITEVERTEFGLLLNDVRGDLRMVMAHDILNDVAQTYTDDIVRNGRTIASGDDLHIGLDGSTIAERALDAGYDYGWIGENIAQGYKTSQQAIDAWLASDRGHREVVLAPQAEDFGIGRTDTTWVLIMGAER
jgi:hypothetical protein